MKRVKIPTYVKWAGGKKQLISQFEKFFPEKVDRYLEPFVGGGAVAFYMLKTRRPKETIISDINKELMTGYKVIRDKLDELMGKLKEHKENHCKEYYYKIRKQDRKEEVDLSDVEQTARFIYLNKTCFNGLYRVNSKGQFNVPIGSYKNPAILMKNDLKEISRLLNNVKVKQQSFEKVLDDAKEGDFVYLDPPYYPLNKDSFTSYQQKQFLDEEHKKLAEVFKKLDEKGCRVMLSNSDTEFVKNLYEDFNINVVRARRSINCNGDDRGKINELVITNYPVKIDKQKKII
ncbi:MAG: DNA adenine methylase [Candidatus Woesearchaeota archaeon]